MNRVASIVSRNWLDRSELWRRRSFCRLRGWVTGRPRTTIACHCLANSRTLHEVTRTPAVLFGLVDSTPNIGSVLAAFVDSDTPVGAAANLLTHGRAAGTGCKVLVAERNRCGRRGIHLRNEDQVTLGVGRHRMRAG